jgi:hypothetical protein
VKLSSSSQIFYYYFAAHHQDRTRKCHLLDTRPFLCLLVIVEAARLISQWPVITGHLLHAVFRHRWANIIGLWGTAGSVGGDDDGGVGFLRSQLLLEGEDSWEIMD